MNLPNYFLADLPPEAALTPTMLQEACLTLKRNREQYLAGRSTQSLINLLSETAENWLQPEYPFRQMALRDGPEVTGFSGATLASGLELFFQQLTRENLHALLMQELGHAHRLDSIVAAASEQKLQHAAMANGPELLFQIAGGNVPNPTLLNIVLGLLLRSAQFVKCPTGASLLPRLFAHSLYESDSKLASCLEIAEWRGGRADLEDALFGEADCVIALGSDETLAAIRSRLPIKTRFLGYGHRLSFSYVAHEALSGLHAKKMATRAAADVVAWDQLGCLSPHVIYVEHGGRGAGAEQFAEMLAEELERRESVGPRGRLPVEMAAVICSKRDFYTVRASHSPATRIWSSKNSTAWTVVYEADARFQVSCLNRFIYVKGVSDLTEVLHNADSVRGKVSTVGLGAHEEKALELATQLERWGVTRVCPLGQMQNPPLTWRHDGRPALGDMVTWTNWEQ